ncbi:MAG: cytochrome P450, partial [Alphaproteobacteria bacterium]|nr:cytochrome P450 [Alphaproteobacteria bacterium]
RRARLAVELQNYLIDRIEDRRKEPKDDMIGIVANAKLEDEDRVLNHGECISILNQFLVAGHETTTSTFGFGMYILCRHPELADQIRGDSKRIRTFVEEALRLEAPVQGLPRVVTKDTVLGDTKLKAGDMIMLRYGAANRDERHFESPDECDVHRKNAGSQLAFGSGIHHCVGAPLARSELNIGFSMMLERMENFRLSRTPEVEPSFILRSFPELWIEFDKRS